MSKHPIQIEEAIKDFGEIPYSRTLEERALFPYSDLNYLTGGIVCGGMTVIVADAGAGKTTMVSDTINKMIADGDKVFGMFGEGTIKEQQDKMFRQMTPFGHDNYTYVQYQKNEKKTNIGCYFVDEQSERIVREKTKGKLFLYDIRYGMRITDIVEAIEFAIARYDIRYVVLDNASQIETVTNSETKELKDAFEVLRQLAITKRIGIIVLAHYRKQADTDKFRRDMTEIMGTSALSQKAISVISLIRMDYQNRNTPYFKSFARLLKENGWDLNYKNNQGKYAISSVVEVLKSRNNSLGFCCLGFNVISQTYYQINRSEFKSVVLFPSEETTSAKKGGIFDNLEELVSEDLPF